MEGHSAQFGSARLHCFVLKTGFIITAALCVLINGWMDSWSRCNILTRLLCDNNLVMTEIERLMNVSSYFSDNGNNSSWIDHFVCIVFLFICRFSRFSSFFYFIWTSGVWNKTWMNEQKLGLWTVTCLFNYSETDTEQQRRMAWIILHCVPKKHVTTFSMISWSRTVRLRRFLAHLLQRV